MGIIVLPHNEADEQKLREFLKNNGYEFFFTETNQAAPPDSYHQSLEEYNSEIAGAEAAYERGDSLSAEELKKIMLTW
jgi:hypothetical protein